MNKHQKALYWLSLTCDCDKDNEAVETLQELVDKQTIKKPIADLNEDGEPYLPRGVKLCPVCGERVNQEYNKNYCGNCRQKLDWVEEDVE